MSSKTNKKVTKNRHKTHLFRNILTIFILVLAIVLIVSGVKSFFSKDVKSNKTENNSKQNQSNKNDEVNNTENNIEQNQSNKNDEVNNTDNAEQNRTNKNDENSNNSENNTEQNQSNKNDNDSNNKNQNSTTDNNKNNVLSQDDKLKKLDYINEKVDYFKMENLDRYVAYKEKNPKLSNEKVVLYVNIGIDRDFYTNVQPSPRQNTNLILTNKYYQVSSSYVPKDLVEINSEYKVSGKEVKMTKEAAEAFEEMAAAAKKDGYTVRAISTYRSYSYQNGLYNNYVKKDGKAKADTYSARPGYSEHQTGLAVDVDNAKLSYTSFGKTNEFNWMKEHCYEYGFILRYTSENEFLTGYKNEPWHYRYVGKEVAKQIKDENISSYEEYYFMYLDK